ncbi:MAG TPA: SRPBCC family protein [Candidatus Thermoplasmatota archaeon]|nr:SRPBCC family protein [Candidatus Thermoplasmatota archaeon]
MKLRCEALAKGVTPEAAYGWWTQFQEGCDDHRFFRMPEGSGRRLLRVTPSEVEMEDAGRILWIPFIERTLALLDPPRAVHLRGRNSFSEFRGTYHFLPHPEGTLVRFEGDVFPLGFLAILSPLGAPLVRAFVRKDLQGHVKELSHELATG